MQLEDKYHYTGVKVPELSHIICRDMISFYVTISASIKSEDKSLSELHVSHLTLIVPRNSSYL